MRDYSRSAPQDTTWNSAPSFENLASGSATIANPEVNSNMGFSPAFQYPYAQPSNLGQMMYPVSTQRLMFTRALAYLVASQDMFSPWPTPMPTPCRSHSFFCHGLVFTQTKASTDGDSVPSSSQSDASWAENIYSPCGVMAEPYGVSASCPSTRGHLTLTPLQIPGPSSSTAPAGPSGPELTWFETPGQFNDTTSYLAGGGSAMGAYTPHIDFLGVINTTG